MVLPFPNALHTVFVDMDMPSVFEIKIQIMIFLKVVAVVLSEKRYCFGIAVKGLEVPLRVDIVFDPEIRIEVVQFVGRNACIAAGLYFRTGIGQQCGTSRCLIVPIQRTADVQAAFA